MPLLARQVRVFEGRLQRLAEDVEAATRPADLWRRVREEFALNPGFTHLNCGSVGATPRPVLDVVASTLREIEGSPVGKVFGWGGQQMEAVRTRAADFIGAGPDEVALTRNTTEAMNAVAMGLDLGPGDQVLTTNREHGGGMVCWQHLRKHHGIDIVYVHLPRMVQSGQQVLELVREKLTPRTKVCSFSHIDTITGIRMPIAEIAALTRPRDIVLVCDGAQAPGMLEVDVKALAVDTYAFSGHKWMLAPKGTGLLYVRKEMQDRIHPAFLYDGYRAYTASGGTRDVASVIGHGATMDFHDAIGRDRIAARCRDLSMYLRGRLQDLPGLTLLTPADDRLSAAIVSYSADSGDAGALAGRLNQEHEILVKRAQGTYAYCAEDGLPSESYNALRFSTHIFNSERQIDRAAEALRALLA